MCHLPPAAPHVHIADPARMVGPGGLEPPTPRLSSACSNQLSYEPGKRRIQPGSDGGADRVRTDDLLLAKQALFQLSYGPWVNGRPFTGRREAAGGVLGKTIKERAPADA